MILPNDIAPLPLFADLDGEMLGRIAHRCADVRAKADEYLVHEGEICNFYVLLSGRLELTKRLQKIEPVMAVRRAPGDYFGEVPLLMGSPAICNLRAVTPSRLMSLAPQDFRWLYHAAPPFAAKLTLTMQERLAGIAEVAAQEPVAQAVVVGRCLDRACHDIRDFLARNHILFEFLDVDDPEAARAIPEFGEYRDACPLVSVVGGPLLVAPSVRRLAQAFDIPTEARAPDYDLAIVGGGPC